MDATNSLSRKCRETLISLLLQHPSARYWRIDQFQGQRHIQAVVVLAMLSLSGIHVQIACDEVPKTSLKRDSYWINPKYFKTQTICKKISYYTCSIQYNGAFTPGLQPMLSFLPPSILIFSYFLPHILASCLAFGFFFPCFLASSLACLFAGRLACFLACSSLLLRWLACSSLLACSRGAPNWKNIPAQKTGKHFPEKYTTHKNSTNLFFRIGCKKVYISLVTCFCRIHPLWRHTTST